jgi:hypothetical protein
MSTKEFSRRVFAYIKQVNRDKDLPSAAVRVGLVIADHWNEKDGEARLSLETIALEGGLGEGTVRRMLPALVERGHLAVQLGSRGSRHSNRYWPLEKSANGGAIESANGGAIAEKPKAPNRGIKAPFRAIKAPTGALSTLNTLEHTKGSTSTARVERGNVTETEKTSDDAPLNPAFNTVDDAPVSEPLTPVPRADARTEPVAAQNQKPFRVDPIGTAAANEHAAPAASPFAQVLSVYPEDRVGDEAKAYFVFARALDARGSLSVVLENLASLMQDYGDDVPFLIDILKTIERMP